MRQAEEGAEDAGEEAPQPAAQSPIESNGSGGIMGALNWGSIQGSFKKYTGITQIQGSLRGVDMEGFWLMSEVFEGLGLPGPRFEGLLVQGTYVAVFFP